MRNWTIGLVAMTGVFVIFAFNNCSGAVSKDANSGSPASALDFSKLTPSCFIPSASNPILTGGSLFAGADWNDPSVLKVDGQYIMYASSDHNFDLNIEIYRLTSSDGVSWSLSPSSPVLSANPAAGTWDHRAVETPSVVFFKGKYHLFYTGYATSHADSTNYRIGHAISDDGITWTRDANYILAPTNPTGPISPDFKQYIVGEPGAVVYQDKIYLYFTAVGGNVAVQNTLQVLGLMTSADGVTWSAPQSVLEPDQSQYPRSSWYGYSTPFAITLEGQMHLFFDVVQDNPWKQMRLHHARSADGVSQWTQDTAPIFTRDQFPWTSNEILAPAALLDGTSLLFWFAGNTGSVLNIGHAKCEL